MQLTPQQFHRKILNWFDRHGRKHLPWQQNKTPYRVWVSEIMLQQTQVTTVIPYFERFMEHFPDLISLAAASIDRVLHLFAGLGYYSRGRNLHKTAQILLEQYHGEFPKTLSELQTLPGIGKSTAGAILAIAFNEPATILDGNVKRVLSRLYGITTPINEKETENKLWELAIKLTPKKRVAHYTQAMMDMGATLCLRSKPQCESCPLQKNCSAYSQQLTHLLPIKKIQAKLPVRTATFLLLKKNGQILLQQRPTKGIWGGLFSLPEISGKPDRKQIRAFCRKNYAILAKDIKHFTELAPFRHTFTHYHLDIFPVLIDSKKVNITMAELSQIWYNPHQPKAIGLPKPVQSLIKRL